MSDKGGNWRPTMHIYIYMYKYNIYYTNNMLLHIYIYTSLMRDPRSQTIHMHISILY